MPNPVVSVVMSTHNYGQFIGETIDSLLAQSYDHFEMIIVDDASTDDTLDVIGQYDDARIIVVKRSVCSGSGEFARNDGLAIAQGDFIAVADADDVYVPDRLALQIDFFRTHPKVDLLGGAMMRIDECGQRDGTWIRRPVFDHYSKYRDAMLDAKNVLIHSTLMFRRYVLDRVPGYNRYATAGDFEFLLHASRYFRLHNLDKVLGYRRVHNASVVKRIGPQISAQYRQQFLSEEYEWVTREVQRLKQLDAT